MHCMLMDLLHGFEVLSTTEETLFNSRNVSRLVQNNARNNFNVVCPNHIKEHTKSYQIIPNHIKSNQRTILKSFAQIMST